MKHHNLVFRPRNTQSLNLFEDGFGDGNPNEGSGITVFGELLDWLTLRSPAKGGLRDDAKPVLDLVEPGSVGRREVEMVAGSLRRRKL